MDFTPTEEQRAAAGLAAEIFDDLATHERMNALDGATDTELWAALCAAGLVGAVVETGLLGLVLLLEEQGRRTAQVPLAATAAYGLLPVAAHGSAAQRERLLPALAAGTAVATGAFPARGRGRVRADSEGRLRGVLPVVPWLRDATHVLVPVYEPSGPAPSGPAPSGPAPSGPAPSGSVPAGPAPSASAHPEYAPPGYPTEAGRWRLWLVETAGPGAVREAVETTAPWSAGRLTLTDAPGEPLGGPAPVPTPAPDAYGEPPGPGLSAYEDVLGCARTAFAGLQAGVCAGSLARAVAHTNTREQFGRPLSTHQGVMLRAADAHMDTEAIRVTAYEAAWRWDEGLEARPHALTAAWWAAEAGRRVVHAGQHLHGGTGADLDHPVHRHFLWGRQLAAQLGGGAELLDELGRLLTDSKAGCS
ncbi:acyl-CoA dehydrogenase family protein [Streptomyces niger]|uniref:acyl-CoA dehydrogenase family protein n=1 Tax=Streptomyces niger TaxID=66373 RepID=UPI0006993427|nr:acyl-CoA dehydrogenase family protein [Streptomyces niger]